MKLGVMQPYTFPYIGYFQLIKSVDIFVFYDDVNFIKQGWINRNNILVNEDKSLFTIPLSKASSYKSINQTELNSQLYKKWRDKFLRKIQQSYQKAPYFDGVLSIVEKTVYSDCVHISELAILSIKNVAKYLELPTSFLISSKQFRGYEKYERTERLVKMCVKENATTYINAIGGQELYDKTYFAEHNINLKFLKQNVIPYKQFNNNFIGGLSIIDVLMFNSKSKIHLMLNDYKLV